MDDVTPTAVGDEALARGACALLGYPFRGIDPDGRGIWQHDPLETMGNEWRLVSWPDLSRAVLENREAAGWILLRTARSDDLSGIENRAPGDDGELAVFFHPERPLAQAKWPGAASTALYRAILAAALNTEKP